MLLQTWESILIEVMIN